MQLAHLRACRKLFQLHYRASSSVIFLHLASVIKTAKTSFYLKVQWGGMWRLRHKPAVPLPASRGIVSLTPSKHLPDLILGYSFHHYKIENQEEIFACTISCLLWLLTTNQTPCIFMYMYQSKGTDTGLPQRAHTQLPLPQRDHLSG